MFFLPVQEHKDIGLYRMNIKGMKCRKQEKCWATHKTRTNSSMIIAAYAMTINVKRHVTVAKFPRVLAPIAFG